jgi:RsiW-degrading membrane proteinase PrsW (M82 family)
MNNLFITIPAAVIPSLLLVFYFWKNDKLPEPPKVVGITFIFGILSVIPAVFLAVISSILATFIENPFLYGFYQSFFVAAIPEELSKFLVIYLFCYHHPSFDEKMDGLVYGATASLGFATFENILYVSEYGYSVAITRALTAVPCHAIFGMVIGYYLAKRKFDAQVSKSPILKGLLISIFLHGFYDLPLLIQERVLQANYQIPMLFHTVLFLASWIIIILIYIYAWSIINKVKKAQIKKIEKNHKKNK